KGAHQLTGIVDPADAEFAQTGECDAARFVHVEPLEWAKLLLGFGGQDEVAGDAHQGQGAHFLVHGGNAAFARLPGRTEVRDLAIDQQFPFGRTFHAGQDLDDRRLAGAVLSKEAQDLPGLYRERQIADGLHPLEMLGHIAQFYDRSSHLQRPIANWRSRELASTASSSRSPMKSSVSSEFQPR